MLPENAIEVKNITKKFKVYIDKGTTLKEKVLFKKRRAFEERVVLDDISFSVKKGEAIGLIGNNGCGKSTTLKLLTRIMYPDSGSIEIQGRVSSLLELGAGFHPDMTGRENIYTNASIFGLTKKEIDKRVNDIIAFSELDDYIDNPVRTYSSGMYMRLAFSVAINVDAEVLLIDEILAVGDANFQAKCFNKLREIKAKGTTIVIVSHSLGQIEQICERSIWIKGGKIAKEGNPYEVHPAYLGYMGELMQEKQDVPEEDSVEEIVQESAEETGQEQVVEQESQIGNQSIVIKKVNTYDANSVEKSVFKTGETILLNIDYEVHTPSDEVCIGVGFFRSDGVHCYGTNTRADKIANLCLKQSGTIQVELKNELLPGEYLVDVAIESAYGVYADYKREICRFITTTEYEDIGVSRICHKWHGDCFDSQV